MHRTGRSTGNPKFSTAAKPVLSPTPCRRRLPQAPLAGAATIAPDPFALVPMSGQLRREIAESAKAFGGVPRELQKYVDSELIKPAFEHAKADWANTGQKFAQDGAATIANGIANAK